MLGVTSFGGPTAHLGYFRAEFVNRRRWLSDADYADLVALCQFLPGPASSQVGMAVGWRRAGLAGMLAAFVGFTAPSVLLMCIVAAGVLAAGDVSDAGWIAGLKAAAVAVVAHAVMGMARTLIPDAPRATIAVAVCAALLLAPGVVTQLVTIVCAGLAGLMVLRAPALDSGHAQSDMATPTAQESKRRWLPAVAGVLFVALLVGLPVAAASSGSSPVAMADMFYRAGALVFGGGHVVLPLLEADTMRLAITDADTFLAGYGAAQAVPGPLFTFAAYLGYVSELPPGAMPGALLATLSIFAPAALLVTAILPVWDRVRHLGWVRRSLLGINAAVVGILAAALYNPVWTSSVSGPRSVVFVVVAYLLLTSWKVPAWAVVVAAALAGWVVL